jgi:hypothetical protein
LTFSVAEHLFLKKSMEYFSSIRSTEGCKDVSTEV